jgi:nucleotide-binding universal stress UspA family protein
MQGQFEPALRSILVPLDGSAHSAAAVDLAIEWGRLFGARLVGVGIIDEPTILKAEPVPLGAFSYKEVRDEARLEDARSRVRQFLSKFQAQCTGSGLIAGTVEVAGHPADRILREAQRCDLVMIGRDTNFRFETQDYPDKTMAPSFAPVLVRSWSCRPSQRPAAASWWRTEGAVKWPGHFRSSNCSGSRPANPFTL